MKIKINIDLKVGRVVKYFILADLIVIAGWGFMEPVFSVYIIRSIAGATLATVGISAAIYWLLKSALQIPIANHLDKNSGESDDFHFLIAGLFISALAAFSFILIDKPWELYLVQVVHAVAFALYVPSWSGIFSRHLDKNRMAFDWSLDSTAVGLSMGVSVLLGGILANSFGFAGVFIAAAVFSMTAALVLIMAPELILPRKNPEAPVVIKDHTPLNIEQ